MDMCSAGSHIAEFLKRDEIAGVVWKEKEHEVRSPYYLEVFDTVSGARICTHDLPERPHLEICTVAVAPDFTYVAVLSHDLLSDYLMLTIFNLGSKQPLCRISVGESDDPSWPPCALAFARHPCGRLACAADGQLRLYTIDTERMSLSLIWEKADIWTEYLAFLSDAYLAYCAFTECLPGAARIPDISAQLIAVKLDSAETFACINFPASVGEMRAFTCMPQGDLVTAGFQHKHRIGLPSPALNVYEYVLVPGNMLSADQFDSAAHLYASLHLGGAQVVSLSRTPRYLLVGTHYGHVHIADGRSHRILHVGVIDEHLSRMTFHIPERDSNNTLVLRLRRGTPIDIMEALGALMWH